MTTITTKADMTFYVEGDIYKVQRRPNSNQLVLNWDYKGIQIIDPLQTDQVVNMQLSFPPKYGNVAGVIDEWCFQADGKAVLLINEETKSAAWLSLDTHQENTYDLGFPQTQNTIYLQYLWENITSFWIKCYGPNEDSFFRLNWRDEKPFFIESTASEAETEQKLWYKAVRQLEELHSQVLKSISDQTQVLFHDFSSPQHQIGMLDWVHNEVWSIQAPPQVPRIAFVKDLLFVMDEYETTCYSKQGVVKTIYTPPQGFYFCGLDTLIETKEQPAALVLIAAPENGDKLNQGLVYFLL
jgi:hypothetical protein